jgi:hypothetical protein
MDSGTKFRKNFAKWRQFCEIRNFAKFRTGKHFSKWRNFLRNFVNISRNDVISCPPYPRTFFCSQVLKQMDNSIKNLETDLKNAARGNLGEIREFFQKSILY